nr:RluA family pseudouridine synthase [Paenibacillus shirakamiensis]
MELTPGKLAAKGEDAQLSAANWLANTLYMPPKLIRRLQAEAGIRVAGDRLRLHLFPAREYGFDPVFEPLNVLYEDDFCLVAHKPAGLKVHPTGNERQPTLAHVVAAHYAAAGEAVAVRHIHRLDEYTSGPVLYAKNDFAQLRLDADMADKRIGRTYVAIAHGQVPVSLQRIEAPIGKDRHHPQRQRVSDTGKLAITHLTLLEQMKEASLIRLQLETGRTHQIRVHMSYAGHPLLGDALYGGPTDYISHQALHGEKLHFTHPLTGNSIEIVDPWSAVFMELYQNLSSQTNS